MNDTIEYIRYVILHNCLRVISKISSMFNNKKI